MTEPTTATTTTTTMTAPQAGSGAMFDRIARRYDLLNRVMSLGVDRRWRRRTADALALPDRPRRVLDVATGTADLRSPSPGATRRPRWSASIRRPT